MKSLKKNQSVQWKWLGRVISGRVKDVFFKPTVRIIKNKAIKRNGSKENPAYLVESEAGNLALKLHSELMPKAKAERAGYKGPMPRMFGDDK